MEDSIQDSSEMREDEEPEGELDESILESQGLTVDKSHIPHHRRGHHNRDTNRNNNNNNRNDNGNVDEDVTADEEVEEEVIEEERHSGRAIQSQLETETIQHLNNFQQQMASMQQQIQIESEAFRQQIEREAANLPTDPATLQAIQRQIEEAAIHNLIDGTAVPVDVTQGTTNPNNKRRKHDKDQSPQLNTCLALGCDRQIKQRRLCPMHQKQKERTGKLELKENVPFKFSKGRTPTPFSKHANKYAKLKSFDKKIDEWAGGREEGSTMLEHYLESSYYAQRFFKQEDSKIYEQVGSNIIEFMKQLPEKSPLRRPLIKAVSENIALSRLREVLPVSKQTVINSKKLSDQDNLLLTIKYKPNVTRNRKQMVDALGNPIMGEEGNLNDELSGNDELNNAQSIMETFTANPPHIGNSSQLQPLSERISQMTHQAIAQLNSINQMGQIQLPPFDKS